MRLPTLPKPPIPKSFQDSPSRPGETEKVNRLEQVKEECRDARGMVRLIQDLGQDIRYGLRLMRKAPVFSSLSIVSLGLAIGARCGAETELGHRLGILCE